MSKLIKHLGLILSEDAKLKAHIWELNVVIRPGNASEYFDLSNLSSLVLVWNACTVLLLDLSLNIVMLYGEIVQQGGFSVYWY